MFSSDRNWILNKDLETNNYGNPGDQLQGFDGAFLFLFEDGKFLEVK